jgi:hypothetical protein
MSPQKKADPARAKLEKEIREAIREIDEEGLLFLLRQAQVIIHNARVDRMNATARTAGRSPAEPEEEARPPVSIEDEKDGKAIFLTFGPARKVLTREEMMRIVRICYAAESKSEALRRLFTTLAKERKDILADARVGSPDNPLLGELFAAVRARYRLPDR